MTTAQHLSCLSPQNAIRYVVVDRRESLNESIIVSRPRRRRLRSNPCDPRYRVKLTGDLHVQALPKLKWVVAAIPENIAMKRKAEVLCEYLLDHPTQLDQNAARHWVAAAKAAWPCE
jgi:hypothetical protein